MWWWLLTKNNQQLLNILNNQCYIIASFHSDCSGCDVGVFVGLWRCTRFSRWLLYSKWYWLLCGKVSSSKLLSVKFGLLSTIKNTFHLNDDAVSGVLGVCNARNFPETDHILFQYTEVLSTSGGCRQSSLLVLLSSIFYLSD